MPVPRNDRLRDENASHLHIGPGTLVTRLGRDLLVPDPVIVEVDQLLRHRVGLEAARMFLSSMSTGEHVVAFLSPGLLRRAVEIDERYADLDLGSTDSVVVVLAERKDLPVHEARYREATRA